jgi:serine/threonine-protein kinase
MAQAAGSSSSSSPSARPPSARAPTWALWGLAASAVLTALWAVYQWLELLVALEGGPVTCQVSATLDCTAVWFAPAAKAIHRLSGVPVAGWGVVWGLAAGVVTLRLALDRKAGRGLEAGVFGVRVVAVAGAVSVIGFLGVSLAEGVVCPSCLATYAMVIVYAAFSVAGLRARTPRSVWVPGLTPAVLAVAAGWLLLLYPGIATPLRPEGQVAPDVSSPARADGSSAAPEDALSALVAKLPPRGAQALAKAVASLRSPPKNEGIEPRRRAGPADAPVLVTDFSDLRCGHCKNLAEALRALRERLEGRFAEDARYFPLSARCNPEVPEEMVDPSGARCFAAKALLCLEDRPAYFELRHRLFEAQADLTVERVEELAEEVTAVGPDALAACVASPEVEQKLASDIEYAMRYDLKGTPLVLVNGREVPGHPTILYALILARGDPDHPAFAQLPAVASE